MITSAFLTEKKTFTPVIKKENEIYNALNVYGDCVCTFCDAIIGICESFLNVGDKCWRCGAEVIRIENEEKK